MQHMQTEAGIACMHLQLPKACNCQSAQARAAQTNTRFSSRIQRRDRHIVASPETQQDTAFRQQEGGNQAAITQGPYLAASVMRLMSSELDSSAWPRSAWPAATSLEMLDSRFWATMVCTAACTRSEVSNHAHPQQEDVAPGGAHVLHMPEVSTAYTWHAAASRGQTQAGHQER